MISARRGLVKVLDLGIAWFLGQGRQTSNKHRFLGTPLYRSPQHLRGAGVTVRSDVYQFGTVLFELVAGVNPNPKSAPLGSRTNALDSLKHFDTIRKRKTMSGFP